MRGGEGVPVLDVGYDTAGVIGMSLLHFSQIWAEF